MNSGAWGGTGAFLFFAVLPASGHKPGRDYEDANIFAP